ACGEDIGYWAVACGLFCVKCPHCRARLRIVRTDRMNRVTSAVAIGAVLLALGAAVLVTWELRDSVGWFAALGIGAAVWLGGSFGIGFVFELATASFVRRTQRLALEGDRDEPDEEIW